MSEIRFLKELGAEFERLGDPRASARRLDRDRRRWPPAPRFAMAGLGLVLSALVVVGVVVIGLGVKSPDRAGVPVPGGREVRIAFHATALDSGSPLGPSIERSIEILRRRLGSVFPGVQVSRAANGIVVVVPGRPEADRARIVALAAPGRLEFYDWEANALTPSGKTVASQLPGQSPSAIELSQGAGSAAPGNAGAGSTSLYAAVQLASKQPSAPTTSGLGRAGREYYLFGAPGSAACATAAKDQHTGLAPGAHCMLLSAPVVETTTSRQQIPHDVASSLLPGINISQGEQLAVPPGTVVLQAAQARSSQRTSVSSPSARFYVLRDSVALAGNDMTHPKQSTDEGGSPDVEFGFNSLGANSFRRVTEQIARRGVSVSRLGQPLNQHFAIALDNQLITVPSIDFKAYPDGVPGDRGADITADFTVQSARDLATVLRFGALPVSLVAR